MTITQMQYFTTVCQFQNISKAAEQLFISQPALSSALSDLEREVGFKLLERKSKGVAPTAEGELLRGHITSVLRRYDLLQRSLPELAEHQNILNVGFRPISGENEFFDLFREYIKECPDVRLHVHEMSNETPRAYLEDGVIDFLIAPAPHEQKVGSEKFERQEIGMGTLQLYCHRDSALAQKEFVSYEDLNNYPVVFWDGQKTLMNTCRTIMEEHGFRLNVVAELPQISGILNFVCNGIAIGLLPSAQAEYFPTLHRLRFANGEDFGHTMAPPKIYMFWKKQVENYSAKKDFVDFVKRKYRSNK